MGEREIRMRYNDMSVSECHKETHCFLHWPTGNWEIITILRNKGEKAVSENQSQKEENSKNNDVMRTNMDSLQWLAWIWDRSKLLVLAKIKITAEFHRKRYSMHPYEEGLSFWACGNDELRCLRGQHQGETQWLERSTVYYLNKDISEDKRYIVNPGLDMAPASPQDQQEETTACIPKSTSAPDQVPWLHQPVSTMSEEVCLNNKPFTLPWLPALPVVANHNLMAMCVSYGYFTCIPSVSDR